MSLAKAAGYSAVLDDYGGPLLRLHIGLEDPDDLIEDLHRGLNAFNGARG